MTTKFRIKGSKPSGLTITRDAHGVPHISANRLPNVWYEQSIHWSDAGAESSGYVLGMGMPGLPGVLIGRNNDVAWGATYTFMDTVDSWVEECRDKLYRRGGPAPERTDGYIHRLLSEF